MATETLRLDITADSAQAKAELQKLNNQLAIFERAIKKATDPAQIQYLNRNIEFLRSNIQTATTANQRFATGSNQAANALTNLGRIAQDAPFGFIGIQNNLNPLLESFQRLKAESGSTSGALKSLAGSLIGPAGLGLALSVASGLILAFGDKLMGASNATKSLDASQKALSDTLSKNLGQAKAEVTTMGILSGIINDTAKSTEDRAEALKQLKAEYPGYEALQKVDINDTAALARVTDILTAAIMRKARVEAYSSLIAAEEAKQTKIALETDKQRADRLGFLSKAIKDYALPLMKLVDPTNANIVATQLQVGALNEAGKEFDGNAKFIDKLKTSLTAVTAEQIKNKDATILGGAATKTKTESVKKLTAAQLAQLALEKRMAEGRAKFQAIRGGQAATGNVQTDTSFNAVGPSQGMIDRTLAVQKATQAQLGYANALRLTAINEEQAANITNVAMSAFTSLGNAMLQGQDIGEALSNTFKRLIVDLTAMVARALLFKAIMAALTGGTSMGFKAGATIGKLLGGGMPFARDGGVFSGPQSGYPAILHGTEAVLNPKQFKNLTSNMMNLGAIQNQGGSMNLSGEFVVRGNDLVYVLNKQGFTNNLLGR